MKREHVRRMIVADTERMEGRWRHKQLDFVMQPCKKTNIHLRHEYAPIIPKCGILLWLKDLPWQCRPHVVIPTPSDPES